MQKIKEILSKILNKLVDCITPTLPIMIGVGMLKVVLIIVGPLVLNILNEYSSTYIVLSFVADAGYYFMPIYVAISSAEVFKTNKYLAALCGAILISPSFVELIEQNINLSIYGIPIVNTNYGNQVIPSIIIVYIMSKIYSFLDKILHENISSLLLPLLTILIMTPVCLSIIGPLGVFLSNKLVSVILFLKQLGPIGNGIMCAIIPYITILGLGGANLSAMLLLASSGVDPILFFSNVLYNNILGFVTLALYFRNKKAETLACAITAAIGGTSEPALFGIVAKDIKALLSLTVAGFVAGLMSGIFKVKSYAMASFGFFGILTTIGPESSIVYAIISLIIGCIVGFVLSYITHTND